MDHIYIHNIDTYIYFSACTGAKLSCMHRCKTLRQFCPLVYIYINIYIHMRDCSWVFVYGIHIHKYEYVCIYACIHICIYICTYIYVYTYMYICVYIHMYLHTYMYMYICKYMHMYIYHIHVYTYTHICITYTCIHIHIFDTCTCKSDWICESQKIWRWKYTSGKWLFKYLCILTEHICMHVNR